MCLPNQQYLILPDADQVPKKFVGKIFNASLPPIALETAQPIVIPDDDDDQTTGGSTGSGLSGAASSEAKATTGIVPTKRRPPLKVAPSSRPKAVLKSTPSTPKILPAVEPQCHHCLSIASSPATTLAPETPRSKALPGPLPSSSSSSRQMGPPPAPSAVPKPKAKPTREQTQREVDTILREAQEKRFKRSEEERQMHDSMLAAIFKAVHEDTAPESYEGVYSSSTKDKMGCDIPRFISPAMSMCSITAS